MKAGWTPEPVRTFEENRNLNMAEVQSNTTYMCYRWFIICQLHVLASVLAIIRLYSYLL